MILGLLILLASYSIAMHGNWMDKYRGVSNTPCCGDRDCKKVNARVIGYGRVTTLVEVDGVVMSIDSKGVHTSEDEYDWYCTVYSKDDIKEDNTRCVFISVGG